MLLAKKRITLIIILFILSVSLLVNCVYAQEEQEEVSDSAEVNAFIRGDIPSIKGNWTTIELTVIDAFGIDWDTLSNTIPEWYMRIIWRFNPAFPQPISRFLGYTGLRFEPEIIQGSNRGWYVRILNNEIGATNPGDIHNINIEARTDDSAIDNAVVIGVKTIRLDTYGDPIGESILKIPVKASPLNFIDMQTPVKQKQTGPRSTVSFDLDIRNEGYYKDVFKFDIRAEGDFTALMNKQSLILESGETRPVTLQILTPEILFDPGTPNKIDIYVYSQGDPNKEFVGSVVVVTQGVYISPLVGIILAPILIVILLVFLWWYMQKTRKEQKLVIKPEKPWNIPEEKAHLETLKEKDAKKYEKELSMMQQEYESALLWYDSYKQYLLQQQKQVPEPKKKTLVTQSPKPEPSKKKPEELKETTKQPIEEPKPKINSEDTQPDIVKKQYDAINKKKQENLRKKQQAIQKIKKQQKKQKKK